MALFKFDATNNKLVPITSEGNIGLPVGAVVAFPLGTTQQGWLACDGRDTTGTAEELQTHYPALYTYLGNSNVLPDYRECVLVGVGQNDTDTIAAHDIYDFGEFKDDQFQGHAHVGGAVAGNDNTNGGPYRTIPGIRPTGGPTTYDTCGTPRFGTTTHGKQKGVAFYIKATSAGIEVDKDLYATKGYIRDQNVLSDYELINLSSPVTMQYDGILTVKAMNDTRLIYVNDVPVASAAPIGNVDGSGTVAFRKGDVVRLSNYYTDCAYAAYYKLRDYTGR